MRYFHWLWSCLQEQKDQAAGLDCVDDHDDHGVHGVLQDSVQRTLSGGREGKNKETILKCTEAKDFVHVYLCCEGLRACVFLVLA